MPKAAPGRRSSGTSKSAQIRALLSSGMSPAEIAKKVGCSTNLVYVVKSTDGAPKRARSRGPGRPSKAAASVNGLDGILAAVKNSQRDREAMRAALEKIQAVIAEVLR